MSFSSSPTCWFHLHTSHTDGNLTVKEIFELAQSEGIQQLYFLEHIRRSPTYSPEQLIEEVHRESDNFEIRADVGFEAKLLPDGTLDISEKDLQLASYVGVAEHAFPPDLSLFSEAWRQFLHSVESLIQELPVIWVHPGLFFRKNRLLEENRDELLEMHLYASSRGILLERNLRYNLMDPSFAGRLPHLLGLDLHKREDIALWKREMRIINHELLVL